MIFDFEKISKQNAFSSSEKEKKGWGTDFHFFNILSKILFKKKLSLLGPYFWAKSVGMGTCIGWCDIRSDGKKITQLKPTQTHLKLFQSYTLPILHGEVLRE